MDFSEGHYPDYRPGYTDYNTMRYLLWTESSIIVDFAMRKNAKWTKYNPLTLKDVLTGLNTTGAIPGTKTPDDVYVTSIDIPNEKSDTYDK